MSVKDRVLSEFMAREMIVDYVLGHLDITEAKAFDRTVEEYSQLKDEIRRIQGALNYCERLSALPVLEEPLVDLAQGTLYRLKQRARREWESPKLKLAAASIVFCVLGITIFVALPESMKEKLMPSHITLFEITKPPSELTDVAPVFGPQPESPQTTQEAQVAQPAPPAPDQGVAAPVAKVPPPATPPAAVVASPRPSPVSQPIPSGPSGEPSELDTETGPPGKFRGFVYRAFTFTNQIETVSPQIKDKILALGGAKAGEVDLGWKKRGGRYFHFTIPESSYEELMVAIQAYGPVRIQKDPHPRIMPAGQIRFILWLEDRGQYDLAPDGTRPEAEQRPTEEIAP